jgi:hypothetical protein
LTIRELLDRVLSSSPKYDPTFTRQFKALVKRVSQDRERVNAAKKNDYRAASKFFDSWLELITLFADDPRSLAALSLPKLRIRGAPQCGAGLDDLFPETATPTLKLFMYFLEPGAEEDRVKYKLSSAKPTTSAKKAKASKKK